MDRMDGTDQSGRVAEDQRTSADRDFLSDWLPRWAQRLDNQL